MAKKTVAPEVPVAVRGVQPHNITDEMRKSYIDYAMPFITYSTDTVTCLYMMKWSKWRRISLGSIRLCSGGETSVQSTATTLRRIVIPKQKWQNSPKKCFATLKRIR